MIVSNKKITNNNNKKLTKGPNDAIVSFGPDIDVAAYKDGGSSCPVVLAVNKKIYQ